MDTTTENVALASRVRDVRRVPLGELADRAAEAALAPGGAFNSSI